MHIQFGTYFRGILDSTQRPGYIGGKLGEQFTFSFFYALFGPEYSGFVLL